MLRADARRWRGWRFGGFVAWRGHPGNLKGEGPLLGTDEEYRPNPGDVLVIGVGAPSLRRAIYEAYGAMGAPFLNLVHPRAEICPSARIGEGNIFGRDSAVLNDAKVGNGNYCNGAVAIAHDAEVGDCNLFGPYGLVLGGARVGSGNAFGPRCTVLDGARVGDGNVVAPGSVIYKGCGSGCRVAGDPAVRLARLDGMSPRGEEG
jgi:acetyltransferase-like isoleucine patch superfamily enzyme